MQGVGLACMPGGRSWEQLSVGLRPVKDLAVIPNRVAMAEQLSPCKAPGGQDSMWALILRGVKKKKKKWPMAHGHGQWAIGHGPWAIAQGPPHFSNGVGPSEGSKGEEHTALTE